MKQWGIKIYNHFGTIYYLLHQISVSIVLHVKEIEGIILYILCMI